ncbi:MAG: thermonuclease family protein [Candidatus Tectimicrobiota bacterium]
MRRWLRPVFLVPRRAFVACLVFAWCLRLAPDGVGAAEPFTGPVVGVSDGDTRSVLQDGTAVNIRLHGIDTPERGQPFGSQARQRTSALAFQQIVTVLVVAPADRYGRVVGEVLLPDGRSLNQELVKAGLAWWYRQYAPKDTTLAQREAAARQARLGLWADAQPVPPWDWRRQPRAPGPAQAKAPPPATMAGPVVGNATSHISHWPGCPGYTKVSTPHRVPFASRAAAEQAGYRPAGNCR